MGSRVTLLDREAMNPDKLFDYLEGRLSPKERDALEEQLMSDKQLQREFAAARQIHAGMRGESREVVLPAPPDVPEQGRKVAIRIGAAFMVLMFVNVGIGLYFIFWHESKNPNRPLLEAQMREQIAKSIERTATFTPVPNVLGVTEITIPAETGKLDAVADRVVAIVSELGGSATKGVPDAGRVSILVDLLENRESEFRATIASIQGGGLPKSPAPIKSQVPGSPTPATSEIKSFVVQIAEAASKKE
jgi:anti-sigma factor RsiW